MSKSSAMSKPGTMSSASKPITMTSAPPVAVQVRKPPPTAAENMRSAIVCVCGMGAFVACDALGKVAVVQFKVPVLQMLALRGLGMLVILFVIVASSLSSLTLSGSDCCLLGMRVILEALGSWLFTLSLMHLPMANATAIVQCLPLAVMLGAALCGESIGPKGWAVSLVGFLGVLIIVRPSADGIDPWSLCALLAVLCMATRDLGTRSLGSRVPSALVAFVGSLGLTSFSVAMSWAQGVEWISLGWAEASCVVGAALTASAGFLSSVLLMRTGSVAFVQPFRYTLLLWASLLGWLTFGEVPDQLTIAGSVVLVCAGYASVRVERERARGTRQAAAAPEEEALGGRKALV